MSYTHTLHVESLTHRERQMAHAVSRGLRNRQIANEFGISEETVKKHLATIYGKLALPGRVALAVYVMVALRAEGPHHSTEVGAI
jgi:DNA-binding CsgD family transcriptional regulator